MPASRLVCHYSAGESLSGICLMQLMRCHSFRTHTLCMFLLCKFGACIVLHSLVHQGPAGSLWRASSSCNLRACPFCAGLFRRHGVVVFTHVRCELRVHLLYLMFCASRYTSILSWCLRVSTSRNIGACIVLRRHFHEESFIAFHTMSA